MSKTRSKKRRMNESIQPGDDRKSAPANRRRLNSRPECGIIRAGPLSSQGGADSPPGRTRPNNVRRSSAVQRESNFFPFECNDADALRRLMSIVPRPMFQLRSLTISMRWEVTRRNPHYYAWWKLARAEHRKEIYVSSEDAALRSGAVVILGMIGVSGEPPDPATSFSELGAEDLDRAWLSGAVHPVSMRGLAGMLLAGLEKSTLRQIGSIFLDAAREDSDDRPPAKIEAMQRLTIVAHPGLDGYPDEPFVSINPAASERKISEAVDQLLKSWKEQRGLEERRERADKYEEYLQVWDLREGWQDGIYKRGSEQTYQEIQRLTKRSPSTLNNQYCRAFEMIVGRPYSRELWLEVMGPIKLYDVIGAGMTRTRRPTTSPTRRPVPDTVVSPVVDSTNKPTIVQGAASGDMIGFVELLHDIRALIDRGRSDSEIAIELELPEDAIASIRKRGDDLIL